MTKIEKYICNNCGFEGPKEMWFHTIDRDEHLCKTCFTRMRDEWLSGADKK